MGNTNFRYRRIKVEIPEDCMLDVLKCLTCPEWSKMRYVSRQINGIVQRNYMRLSLVIIENAFMNQKVNRTANDEDYHNCAQLSKQTHFHVKLRNSIIAYEAVIPQSEAVHWFETRGVALEAPEDVPVERALVGIDFALGSSVDYQKWNIIQLFILGRVRRNGDMRKSWFKHLRLKEKMYDSVVFYAQFHPPNQFSRASLEQFLTFLFHPSTYVKDYHNCAQLSKQTHFQVKLQNSIIAYEAVIPQSETVQWFETRGVALEAPEDVPVERALVGIDFALGSSVDYQKWNIIQLFILGRVRRNGDMRKSWFKHLRLKEKMYDSVVFYAQFHPPNQFSRASLEQFLTFLFHPSTYVKVIRMLAVDQKIVDVVKHKMSTCFSTCGSHQNSNNNNGF